LNLIGCIDTPTSGKIYINDQDVSGRTPDQLADLRARTIGFIFQTFNLLPVLSAAENVEYPLLHRRICQACTFSTVGLSKYAVERVASGSWRFQSIVVGR
jgi:putative ABC transport system ATP-binding protein